MVHRPESGSCSRGTPLRTSSWAGSAGRRARCAGDDAAVDGAQDVGGDLGEGRSVEDVGRGDAVDAGGADIAVRVDERRLAVLDVAGVRDEDHGDLDDPVAVLGLESRRLDVDDGVPVRRPTVTRLGCSVPLGQLWLEGAGCRTRDVFPDGCCCCDDGLLGNVLGANAGRAGGPAWSGRVGACGGLGSRTQNCQPGGADGQEGSGVQPNGGLHPGGGAGHPGAGLKRGAGEPGMPVMLMAHSRGGGRNVTPKGGTSPQRGERCLAMLRDGRAPDVERAP